VRVNPTGGPGLASGGTGDVLAGAIGALLGAGLAPFDAAALGAWLHGAAVEPLGRVGVLASEVARGIPDVWRWLAALETADGDDVLPRFP
jgi:NAD(P)H-hydrate epimerase